MDAFFSRPPRYSATIVGSSVVFMSAPAHRPLSFFSTLLPWLVLGVGLLATGIGWDVARESRQRHIKTDFNLHTERATAEVRQRLRAYELVLRGGVALFGTSGSVSRAQWRAYVERLNTTESLPATDRIGFIRLITDEGKPAHINAMRAEGFINYDIRPGGIRNIYAPVVYLEPFGDRNPRAIGYDMFTEPHRRKAMEIARDQATATISGQVKWTQEMDQKEQSGVLMYLPVYRGGASPATSDVRRAELTGYVYAPIHIDSLISGVLDPQIDGIDLEIFDGDSLARESLLFDLDKNPRFLDKKLQGAHSILSTVAIYNRTLTFRYEAMPQFSASRDDQKPLLVLIGCGVISFLLSGLIWVATRTRDRALSFAAQISASILENEERFSGIFHSAMDAIITIDERQNIILFNPAAEHVFRCTSTQAIGGPLSRFMPERFHALHAAHVQHFGAVGVSDRQMGKQRDLFGLRDDGEEFPLEASISHTTQNGKKLFTVILRDITARKGAETSLRDSEQRFRGLIEASPEAIYIHQDEKIIFVNQAAQILFGATEPDQLIGKSVFSLFHADSSNSVRGSIEAIQSRTLTTPIVERKIVRLNGEIRFVEVAVSGFDIAGKHAIQGMMRDITERYEARAELERSHAELRRLGNALETAQEEERKRLARELHDDLGQTLTVLKMDMSNLRSKLSEAPADPATYAGLLDDIERMDSQLNHTVQSVRRISADLRPVLMDDLGLATALETLIKQVSRSSNIRCAFDLNPDRLSIDKRLATPLFRVAQEALNNIVKHAQATEVKLSLYRDGSNNLILEVRDNGKGLTREDRRKPASFGLIGMRERAYALGGELRVESEPGNGTVIQIKIPNIGNKASI